MSELQVTLEFSVELHKFYNVDLFQRGFYQLRCHLLSSPRLVPAKMEVSLPRAKNSGLLFPPSIINGTAVSKTFQILYRNEEVELDDVIQYRVHLLLDSAKIEETLAEAEFSLEIELWFSEDSPGMDQHNSLQKVSNRTLELDFKPSRGVHYHLPVLFDYFHLSSVSVSVHGALISIHQPYLPSPRLSGGRSGKVRNNSPANTTSHSTMETVLFGQKQLGVKYGTGRSRLAIACTIYQEVCTLLLQALESLQLTLQHLSHFLPDIKRPDVNTVDCRERMKQLINVTNDLETEDEFLTKANSDISQLCAENVILWNDLLDTFTLREDVRHHLALINHHHRVKRFSEGFFRVTNTRKSALCCLDTKHDHYTVISEAVRKSEYFSILPKLQVSCKELDGTPETLPIIFEDVYSDTIIPKRDSLVSTLSTPLWEGCLLVMEQSPGQSETSNRSNIRPASVPVSLDITGINKDHISELGQLSQDTLDRLKQDLSFLVDNTKHLGENKTVAKGKTKVKSKKISLPTNNSEVSEVRKNKTRKRSVDSSLTMLSPSPSPDMKLFLREKLRWDSYKKERRLKKDKESSKSLENSQKTLGGYSHLECCAKVPYNLAEEPEQIEGMKQPQCLGQDHDLSFTSRELINQDKFNKNALTDCSDTNDIQCCQKQSSNHPITMSYNSSLDKDQDENTIKEEDDESTKLSGMAKVRQMVLLNSQDNPKEDSLESTNNDLNSSFSSSLGKMSITTFDIQNREKYKKDTEHMKLSNLAENSLDLENKKYTNMTAKCKAKDKHSDTIIENGIDVIQSDYSRKVEALLIPTRQNLFKNELLKCKTEYDVKSKEKRDIDKLGCSTLPRKLINPIDSKELTSPRLILGKECRSRSEEPVKKTSLPCSPTQIRPRHHSECVTARSQSPIRRGLPNSSVQTTAGVPLTPPEEFQDPPGKKDSPKLEAWVRDNNFAQLRHQKFVQKKSHSIHCDDKASKGLAISSNYKENIIIESEVAVKNLYQTVSEISTNKKMSRSNTISFGEEDTKVKTISCLIKENKELNKPDIRQSFSSSMKGIETIMENKSFPKQGMKTPMSSFDSSYGDSNHGFSCLDWVPNKSLINCEKLLTRISYMQGHSLISFMRAREQFRSQANYPGQLYSDLNQLTLPSCPPPYFTKSTPGQRQVKGSHLIVCVHGLDGNSADLRLVKTYLEIALPSSNLEFLMSEINQVDTFLSFEEMTRKLVNEIMYHVKTCDLVIDNISFIGHSLGCILIRSAIQRPELLNFSSKFHTFLSLSGPHLGTMYNNSGLVNAGMWMMQKWKKSGSLQQLSLKDAGDIRKTFMYKLAEKSNLHLFKNVLLAGSSQDKYVPVHSARIELCRSAVKDSSVTGAAYREMVNNILSRVLETENVELVRYDIHHALPNNTNSLIGRAAHIAVLDSELFIEKFLVIAVLKYFI